MRFLNTEEVEAAWAKEPLIRIRQYLMDIGAWDQKQEEKMLAECSERMDAEIKLYKDAGKPPIESMFNDMFANLPENLIAQRDAAVEEGQHHG